MVNIECIVQVCLWQYEVKVAIKRYLSSPTCDC
jgi:hypothetical protein